MQKYIKYKKEKTYVIDREDFHRHLRNAEAELNMPNDQRMCVQLVNSLYASASARLDSRSSAVRNSNFML